MTIREIVLLCHGATEELLITSRSARTNDQTECAWRFNQSMIAFLGAP